MCIQNNVCKQFTLQDIFEADQFYNTIIFMLSISQNGKRLKKLLEKDLQREKKIIGLPDTMVHLSTEARSGHHTRMTQDGCRRTKAPLTGHQKLRIHPDHLQFFPCPLSIKMLTWAPIHTGYKSTLFFARSPAAALLQARSIYIYFHRWKWQMANTQL